MTIDLFTGVGELILAGYAAMIVFAFLALAISR